MTKKLSIALGVIVAGISVAVYSLWFIPDPPGVRILPSSEISTSLLDTFPTESNLLEVMAKVTDKLDEQIGENSASLASIDTTNFKKYFLSLFECLISPDKSAHAANHKELFGEFNGGEQQMMFNAYQFWKHSPLSVDELKILVVKDSNIDFVGYSRMMAAHSQGVPPASERTPHVYVLMPISAQPRDGNEARDVILGGYVFVWDNSWKLQGSIVLSPNRASRFFPPPY